MLIYLNIQNGKRNKKREKFYRKYIWFYLPINFPNIYVEFLASWVSKYFNLAKIKACLKKIIGR